MNNTLKNITIDKNATINYICTPNEDGITFHTTISQLVAKTYNELLRRFIAADWEAIKLKMKNGDIVTIEPCFEPDDKKCLENVQWFLVYNPTNLFMDGCESYTGLIGTAANLCDYEKLLHEQQEDMKSLQAFYEKHLKGHTHDELNLGNTILINESHDIVRNCKHTPELAKKYGVSEEYYLNCINLAEDFQHYSDWYKSVYQVRPHSL